MEKVYFCCSEWGEVDGPYDSIGKVLDEISAEGGDPTKFKFFEAVEGEYVPPSTPATVRFPAG